MKALIIGATGATGKDLLDLILEDKTIQQVDVFVRRELNFAHDKMKVHIINFDKPEQYRMLVKGDVLFSCLGTTLKVAGSKEAQWKIDYKYQYEFAKFAKENGVKNYLLISAANASAKSWVFYSRMKGQLEDAVRALQFEKLIIFNPPLLIREKTDRKMEVLGAKMIGFFNNVGLLTSQKPIATNLLAQAMLKATKVLQNGQHAIEGQNILDFTLNHD